MPRVRTRAVAADALAYQGLHFIVLAPPMELPDQHKQDTDGRDRAAELRPAQRHHREYICSERRKKITGP